ncbi:MAG TPA: hypothetical protein VHN18_11410 [Micromonosporaceae bacterium]|nr:hypothetical protein [Micromonosporaceae bacterium]
MDGPRELLVVIDEDARRLGSWLATTMRRECLAVLRRQGREVPMESWNDAASDRGAGGVSRSFAR